MPGLRRESRQALLLTFVVWIILSYGSYAVSQLIAGSADFVRDLPFDLPAVLAVALIAFALHPVAERSSHMRPVARGSLVLAAAVVAAIAQTLVNLAENRLLGVIPAFDAQHLPLIRIRFARNFLNHLYLCIATAALFVFLVEVRRTEAQRRRRARAELLAAEARASALSLQLNPHFLFNALNAISSLILDRQPERAEATLTLLAGFLRRSLQANPAELASLASEIETVSAYLEIEKLRFEDRLIVAIDISPLLAAASVPSFLLQPLAENAVKYGVARSRAPVTVRIAAFLLGDRLVIEVADDASPSDKPAAPGLGIGLENIRQRLANRYGDAATLVAERRPEGFVSRVELPLQPDFSDASTPL